MKSQEAIEFSIGSLITLRETEFGLDDENFLSTITGWEDGRAEILTVPKLFGAGSYVTEKHIPEREIAVSFYIVLDDGLVRDTLEMLEAAMLAMTALDLKRTFSDGITLRTEKLAAYITAINSVTIYSDQAARVDMTFLSTDPLKTISTTTA